MSTMNSSAQSCRDSTRQQSQQRSIQLMLFVYSLIFTVSRINAPLQTMVVFVPTVLASSSQRQFPFSASNRKLPPGYKLVETLSRGGSTDNEEIRAVDTSANEEDDDDDDEETEDGEHELEDVEEPIEDEEIQKTKTSKHITPIASFSAPFRMNEATKEEALKSSAIIDSSSDDEDEAEDAEINASRSKGNSKEDSSTPSTTGNRASNGVKTKPPRRKKVMSALDTSRVAPLSSRLMQEKSATSNDNSPTAQEDDEESDESVEEEEELVEENSEEETEEYDAAVVESDEASPREMSDMAKLWWVNTREILSEIEIEEDDAAAVEPDEVVARNATEILSDEEDYTAINQTTTEKDSQSIGTMKQDDSTEIDVVVEDNSNAVEDATVETMEMTEAEGNSLQSFEPLETTNQKEIHPYASSGVWYVLDNVLTAGLASRSPAWQLSRGSRGFRKVCARITGLHGLLSGKPRTGSSTTTLSATNDTNVQTDTSVEEDGSLSEIRSRIAAIDRAREGVERAQAEDAKVVKRRGWLGGVLKESQETEVIEVNLDEVEKRRQQEEKDQEDKQKEKEREEALAKQREEEALTKEREEEEALARQRAAEEAIAEKRRMDRVKEIDKLMVKAQENLQKLACEKDVLQRRPNPLWNYTATEVAPEITPEEETNTTSTDVGIHAERKFNFPPGDLVDEYLDMMFSTRRLVKMNHTYLWKDSEQDDDDDESIGDDLLTPSADAHKLYKEDKKDKSESRRRNGRKNGGGGSWLLRQSIAGGPSLGEKIGEAAEKAAYKAICAAVMSFLARTLSSLHGINVMKYSDIRLVLEATPDLPPVSAGLIPGDSDNYAQETIKTVIRRKAKKQKKRSKARLQSEDSFLQRDAVTEMLLSHVQISAPLLKLFPLAWQRAFLGNIITLATSVMSDFFDGLQFQILGHQLSFAFKPITEADMINHIGFAGNGFNHRRARPEQFEAAVRATAEDVSEGLKFLDRWHERALGSGVLRTQIANLIARIVLTLADEVLSGARIDLWSAPAGGPRMLAGLEYRTSPQNVTNARNQIEKP